MARPSLLTPELEERILYALRQGNYRSAAAKAAGVDYDCFRGWVRKGNQGIQPYAAFNAKLKEAEGESESALVMTIRTAAEKHWAAAAWLLERKYAPKWGRRDMSWENTKREAREAQAAQLGEIPLEELERMIAAEKARRARLEASAAVQ
jgi:transposase